MAKLVLGADKSIVTPAVVIEKTITPAGKYKVLDRVKDDSNNEIGIVVGFHRDANNTEYAIVVLDAQFRLNDGQMMSRSLEIPALPGYDNYSVYGAKETATFNCDAILARATAIGATSTAISHCRAQTFMVDGVQYAGQVPTLMELVKILEFMTDINAADPTASSYPSLVLPMTSNYFTSTVYYSYWLWCAAYSQGRLGSIGVSYDAFIAPILELPNE